jgi:hypothetical protein
MGRSDIPDDVLHFIERRIDSIPHLEALLLFWDAPTLEWTMTGIASRVYIKPEQAQRVLEDLMRSGLILPAAQMPEGYVYNPAWDEPQLMTRVAAAYRTHLVQMSRLIHAKAASHAVRDFARAFNLKSGD